jgi:hypothetical protein
MRLTGAAIVVLIGLVGFMPADHTLSSSAQLVDWAPQGDASDVTSMPQAVPDRGGDAPIRNSCLLDPADNLPGSLDPLLTTQKAAQDVSGRSTLGVCVPDYSLACGGSDTWNNGASGSTDQIDSYSCIAWDESGPEYTYTFTSNFTGQVIVSLSNMAADLDVFVLDDSWGGCNSDNCIAFGNTSASFSAVAGGIYHIVVDGYAGAVSNYTVSLACVDPPEIDVSPASLNVAVPVGGSDSALMAIANLGDQPLDWNLSSSTGGTNVVGEWTTNGDWYCDGSSVWNVGFTFGSDGTFATGDGNSGTWAQTNNAVVLTFSNGQTVYNGYIAGDVIAGTMSSYGMPGCWEATRGAPTQAASVSGEFSSSGERVVPSGVGTEAVAAGTAPTKPSLEHEPALAWLSVAPTSGTAAGGGASSVTVGVDGAQYTAGEYGLLRIYSNDADERLVAVPVAVTMQAVVKAGTATAPTGGSVVAPVTASLPNGKALGAFNLTVAYNAAVVQATACSVAPAFLGACSTATPGASL